MRIIHQGPLRTRATLIRQTITYGLLFGWACWILVRGLQRGAFSLRVSVVEAGSPFYLAMVLVVGVLTLLVGGLCAEAIGALSQGRFVRPTPVRDGDEA